MEGRRRKEGFAPGRLEVAQVSVAPAPPTERAEIRLFTAQVLRQVPDIEEASDGLDEELAFPKSRLVDRRAAHRPVSFEVP